MTQFVDIYNRFLGKITDDMYVELTPQDTIKDLRNMLIDAIPGFEFPRKNLQDYTILEDVKPESELTENDFVLGILWDDTLEDEDAGKPPLVVVEKSNFTADLNSEEINILAILMMCAWVQRQVTSIENTRMKYSGSDFKMTSQANHLAKLVSLQDKVKQEIHHFQRLYGRRRLSDDTGLYESSWDVFKKTNYWYDD